MDRPSRAGRREESRASRRLRRPGARESTRATSRRLSARTAITIGEVGFARSGRTDAERQRRLFDRSDEARADPRVRGRISRPRCVRSSVAGSETAVGDRCASESASATSSGVMCAPPTAASSTRRTTSSARATAAASPASSKRSPSAWTATSSEDSSAERFRSYSPKSRTRSGRSWRSMDRWTVNAGDYSSRRRAGLSKHLGGDDRPHQRARSVREERARPGARAPRAGRERDCRLRARPRGRRLWAPGGGGG